MRGVQLDRPATTRSIDEKIIPMINLIFILLLFFMVTGSLSEIDDRDVTPPTSVQAGAAASMAADWVLLADGRVRWNGRDWTLAELRSSAAADGLEVPAQVRVRADANARAEILVPLLDWLRVGMTVEIR